MSQPTPGENPLDGGGGAASTKGESRVSARILIPCLSAWGLIVIVEGLSHVGMIGELEKSVGRFAIWCGLSIIFVVWAVRCRLPKLPMLALMVFVIFTNLRWALSVADNVHLADGSALIDRDGMFRFVLKNLIFVGWVFGLGCWIFWLLRSIERQREELAVTVARLEREIKEHLQSEAGLLESKSLYTSLVESLDQCVFRKDTGGRFTFANQRFCEMTGRNLDDLLGKTDRDLYSAELCEKYRADDLRVVNHGETVREIEQYVAPDGTQLQVEVVKTPVYDNGGAIVGVQGIFWDVTEKQRVAEDVRLRERWLKSALNATGTSCWQVNLKTGELESIRPSMEWMGYSPDEIPTSREWWRRLIHPEDTEIPQRALEQHLKGRSESYECEYRIRGKSGKWYWILDRGRVVAWDDNGDPLLIVGTDTDVTQLKESSQAFAESEEKFRNLFDTARDAIFIADAETGIIVDVNDAAAALVKYDKSQLVGMHQSELHAVEEKERYQKLFADHVRLGAGVLSDLKVQASDGQQIPVEISAVVFTASCRKLIQGTFRDMTERAQTERALRESEQRFRTIFESEPECVKLIDASGMVLDMNPAGLKMVEAESIEAVRGHQVQSLIAGNYRSQFARAHASVFRGNSEKLTFEIVGLRGTRRWMESHQVPLRDSKGKIAGMLAVSRDITAHKKSDQLLRKSERRFRSVFEQAGVAVGVIESSTGKFFEVNNKFAQLLGYTTEEITKKTWMEITHPDDVEAGQRNVAALTTGESTGFTSENRLIHQSGSQIWMNLTVSAIQSSEQPSEYHIVIGEDITDRKQADREIRIRAAQQAAVAEFGHFALSSTELDELIDESVSLLARVLGCEYSHALELQPDGRSMRIRKSLGWNPEIASDHVVTAESATPAGETLRTREPVVVVIQREDSRFSSTPLFDAHEVTSGLSVVIDGPEQPYGVLGINTRARRNFTKNDINFLQAIANILAEAIARKTADDSLRESEKQYRSLLENHVDGVMVVVGDRVQYVNDRMTDICGFDREELKQNAFVELFDADERSPLADCWQQLNSSSEAGSAEFRIRTKHGRTLTVEISSRAVRYRGEPARLNVVRDVTLNRKLEEESRRHRDEMAHFNRISTMGEMATGMAHELNQPLTSIATYASIGMTKVTESGQANGDTEIAMLLSKIQEQSLRAGEIIHRLRTFVKKERAEHVEFSLNDAVRSAVSMMTSDLEASGISTRLELADDLPKCVGSVVQIEQIILNLTRNATEAMRDGAGVPRELIVRTEFCKNRCLVVEVCDTGPGIDVDDVESIFDAFVTSKPSGMGMGLPISKSIAEAHHGSLTATLNDSQGMTFRLTLPASSTK